MAHAASASRAVSESSRSSCTPVKKTKKKKTTRKKIKKLQKMLHRLLEERVPHLWDVVSLFVRMCLCDDTSLDRCVVSSKGVF